MKNIKCPSCNHIAKISDDTCPNCGYKFTNEYKRQFLNKNWENDNAFLFKVAKLKPEDMEKVNFNVKNRTNYKVGDTIFALLSMIIIVSGWVLEGMFFRKIWFGILISLVGMAVVIGWQIFTHSKIKKITEEEMKKMVDSYSKDNNK